MEKQPAPHSNQKHRMLSGVMSGVIIIWLGVVFLLDRLDLLASGVSWVWYFLFGLGVIFLLEVIAGRLLLQSSHHSGGRLIAAVLLMAVGAWQITGLGEWWPLLLIAAGLVLVVTSLRGSRGA